MPVHPYIAHASAARGNGRSRPRQQPRPARAQTPGIASLAVLTVAIGSGCLFLDEINSPPQAQVETVVAGPYYRGTTIAVRADKSDDPNGDRLIVDWKAFTCSADRTVCDAPAFQELARVSSETDFMVEVPMQRALATPEPVQVIAVEAEVFDTRGASHSDRVFIDLTNLEPELTLQPQGILTPDRLGFPVGARVRIASLVSDPEDDALVYTWERTSVSGSSDDQWSPDGTAAEITPDVPGSWEVSLTVTDSLGASVSDHATLTISADGPPCILSLDPPYVPGARYIVDRDAPARRFTVLSARDDLDSYPRRRGDPTTDEFFGTAHFRWFIATPDTGGQLTEVAGHQLADYLLDPSGFAPGDQLSLRVEAQDRIERDLICGDADPTCSLVEDCMQRVTWDVEVR